MKISLKWLNKYADISDLSADEIAEALPMLGLEVENVETIGLKPLNDVIVGEILSREQHPNADKLGVCMVRVDSVKEPIQIVCGATNYKVGDRVPVALPGAKLPAPDGGVFEIKVSRLRGVESNGMMCSARELGLGTDHSGLLILAERPEIGTPINDVFKDSDTVFEIELTANRGDCLSHIGVAREIAAKFGRKLKKPELKYTPLYSEKPDGALLESVESQTANCPLYTAASIKGVKIAPSPEWLRRDLESVGLRSINNVVDVTNYVLMEYGQPLHAFDASKIRGKKISVRQALDGEKIRTLDGKEHSLTPEATLICDGEGPVALAGIMGGLDSEVTDDTLDVVIESAYFNPGNVRATSRKYAINTDSSYRFARDVDPQSTLEASRRAVDLILETAGGSVCETTCKVGNAPRGDRIVEIAIPYMIDRLGFEISQEDAVKAFESLGFGVSACGEKLSVCVPSFRSEVDRPIDLVEEFVRIYGTEKIPETEMAGTAGLRDDDRLFKYNCAVADFLAARGLNECQNYTLRDSAKISKTHANTEYLKLANPLTSDQDSLRPSLLDGLLDTVLLNISNGNDFYGFFENGKIFRPDAGGEICELAATAFAIAPDPSKRVWEKRGSPDFFTAKEFACDILGVLGIDASRFNFQASREPMWQEGFSAAFGSEKREGFTVRFGAISAAHLRDLGIGRTVYAGEIAFKPEVAGRSKKGSEKFRPFSQFPAASRDVAIIVGNEENAADVESEIRRIAKQKLKGKGFDLESVELFDIYRGKGVGEECKSLAYALSFRSAEKTLQTDEVNGVFDAICAELSKKRKLRAS